MPELLIPYPPASLKRITSGAENFHSFHQPALSLLAITPFGLCTVALGSGSQCGLQLLSHHPEIDFAPLLLMTANGLRHFQYLILSQDRVGWLQQVVSLAHIRAKSWLNCQNQGLSKT